MLRRLTAVCAPVCLCRLYRRCLCPDEVRRQTLQHRQRQSQTLLVFIQELLFADNAALTSHSEKVHQRLVDKLSHACKEFGLTISLRKTNILVQGAESLPVVITIDNMELEIVDTFTYLGSTVFSSTSLDAEISSRVAKQLLSWPNSTSECGAMTC